MSEQWTVEKMPDLSGRLAVVTGANSGIGFETTRELARKGAHVVMACRNLEKAQAAQQEILSETPGALLEVIQLDLADLAAVHEFVDAFNQRHNTLDILINNAGVMAIPRRTTADGFEMQFGADHLGHFALTGLLLEPILQTPRARIVTVSSMMHQRGKINFDDLQGEGSYNKNGAYSQSKLANLLFAFELQRKLEAIGASAISVGAHPGYAATNLQFAGPRMEHSTIGTILMQIGNGLFAQSAAMGALPLLYAATATDVQGGTISAQTVLWGFGDIRPRCGRALPRVTALRRRSCGRYRRN